MPGYGRQIYGHCRGPDTIRYSGCTPMGVGASWPLTCQDDYCEHHPEFDRSKPKAHDEPFWVGPPTPPTLEIRPLKYQAEKPRPSPKPAPGVRQGSLFD